MGTLVNGIKEIFATAKTTGSNVMLCGNDGTPDGHMTMANLASVLGVADYGNKKERATDLNAINDSGIYSFDGSTLNTPFNSTHYGIVLTSYFFSGGIPWDGSQILFATDGQIWQGSIAANHWANWQRIDNYGTTSLSDLANALGAFTTIDDADVDIDGLQSGHYRFDTVPTNNAPFANELFNLLCFNNSDRILQVAYRDNNIKYRIKWGTWNGWVSIANNS